MRDIITNKGNESAIKRQARRDGMRTLREDGIVKVENGITTLEEVLKNTNPDEAIK